MAEDQIGDRGVEDLQVDYTLTAADVEREGAEMFEAYGLLDGAASYATKNPSGAFEQLEQGASRLLACVEPLSPEDRYDTLVRIGDFFEEFQDVMDGQIGLLGRLGQKETQVYQNTVRLMGAAGDLQENYEGLALACLR
ncbi:hypothetical protein HOC01_04815 [archaeon]|jgi:hypothetical protein|nr:hypothetical protein [archaeon]MBT6698289.1 hypothetical protein [archaeon]